MPCKTDTIDELLIEFETNTAYSVSMMFSAYFIKQTFKTSENKYKLVCLAACVFLFC